MSPDFLAYGEAWRDGRPPPADAKLLGIVTLEDVMEQLIQEEIMDEFDLKKVGLCCFSLLLLLLLVSAAGAPSAAAAVGLGFCCRSCRQSNWRCVVMRVLLCGLCCCFFGCLCVG